ncbi:hypothetical protein QFC21_004457 [Naganishia friedmannii]|uniref:Uncharacterized protein n=1 Tax=Naganishia friedmannii TaxID=89922 RepID=A0ACC2VG63_9TREE|nr:hypothetical protein QFC21_004457 [Naganishia friedmannii]
MKRQTTISSVSPSSRSSQVSRLLIDIAGFPELRLTFVIREDVDDEVSCRILPVYQHYTCLKSLSTPPESDEDDMTLKIKGKKIPATMQLWVQTLLESLDDWKLKAVPPGGRLASDDIKDPFGPERISLSSGHAEPLADDEDDFFPGEEEEECFRGYIDFTSALEKAKYVRAGLICIDLLAAIVFMNGKKIGENEE